MTNCPCGSGKLYKECCQPLIKGEKNAQTAEELMRSRYTAYTQVEIDYIIQTTHPDNRANHDIKATRKWAQNSEWHKLEIIDISKGNIDNTEGKVEFIAYFSQNRERQKHHEIADFKKIDEIWYFEDGHDVPQKPIVRSMPKTGRNDPCPCGSGKKYKKCCANQLK